MLSSKTAVVLCITWCNARCNSAWRCELISMDGLFRSAARERAAECEVRSQEVSEPPASGEGALQLVQLSTRKGAAP